MRLEKTTLQKTWQEFYYSTLFRGQNSILYAHSVFLNPVEEISVLLKVDISHLSIKQASWESVWLDAGNRKAEQGVFTELTGVKAFPEANRLIFQLPDIPSFLKLLLNDSINAIIQGEAYFFKERGFKTRQAYDNYCMQTYNINCRLSDDRLKGGPTWMEYVGPCGRQNCLYSKFKHITLTDNSLSGFMSDSFHEMNVNLMYQMDRTVTDSEIQIFRAPGNACFENAAHHIHLIGEKVDLFDYSFLKKAIGGKKGCFHLLDLVQCMALSVSDKIPRTGGSSIENRNHN